MLKFLLLTLAITAASLEAQSSTLIGGKPVPAGTFDPVVYIQMGNGRCSATIVSDRVLITAAHCARANALVSFQHNRNRYTARCSGHPSYPRQDFDVSLCLINMAVKEVKPASIDVRGVTRGEVVTLTGYGGTIPGSGQGGNDGTLRYGDSIVTGFSTYDFITSGLGVAVAFGDSGSGVFRRHDLKSHLYQVGVVSKGNIRSVSYIANLALASTQNWMRSFERTSGQQICGLSKRCDQPPKPDPDCKTEQAAFNKAQDALDKCLAK